MGFFQIGIKNSIGVHRVTDHIALEKGSFIGVKGTTDMMASRKDRTMRSQDSRTRIVTDNVVDPVIVGIVAAEKNPRVPTKGLSMKQLSDDAAVENRQQPRNFKGHLMLTCLWLRRHM